MIATIGHTTEFFVLFYGMVSMDKFHATVKCRYTDCATPGKIPVLRIVSYRLQYPIMMGIFGWFQ